MDYVRLPTSVYPGVKCLKWQSQVDMYDTDTNNMQVLY